MSTSYIDIYRKRFGALQEVARSLESILTEHLAGTPRIDRIAARAKAPASFANKAAKQTPDGKPKYADPISQIQDQIGARVVVHYRDDVEAVSGLIERYLRAVERKAHVPESAWEFGYFGKHWILVVPMDAVPEHIDRADVPDFFELQVKTLFEHAWSQANHDLTYKTVGELSLDQQRRCAFTSAQAWGADKEFAALFKELNGVSGGAPVPALHIE